MSNVTNITDQSVNVISDRQGSISRVVVNTTTANGVIEIWDSTSTAGTITKIGTITSPGALLQSHAVLDYEASLSHGLTVKTSAADQDVTVIWD